MLNPTIFYPIWTYANITITALATILFVYLTLSKKLDFKFFSEPELIQKKEQPRRATVILPENLADVTFKELDQKGTKFITETVEPEAEAPQQTNSLMPEKAIIASLTQPKPAAAKTEEKEKPDEKTQKTEQQPKTESIDIIQEVKEVTLAEEQELTTKSGLKVKLEKGTKLKVLLRGLKTNGKGEPIAKEETENQEELDTQISSIDEEEDF